LWLSYTALILPDIPSQRFVVYIGELSATMARRADDGISGIFRGGPTPPVPSRATEIGNEPLRPDTNIGWHNLPNTRRKMVLHEGQRGFETYKKPSTPKFRRHRAWHTKPPNVILGVAQCPCPLYAGVIEFPYLNNIELLPGRFRFHVWEQEGNQGATGALRRLQTCRALSSGR